MRNSTQSKNQLILNRLETYLERYYFDIKGISTALEDEISYDKIFESPIYENTLDSKQRELEDFISQKDETFSHMLLRMIDERGMSDVEAYKKAHVDRRLFSKIRSDKDYKPSKDTVILFILSLNLNLDDAFDLLQRAGYALSSSNKFDLIIQFFIEEEIYDFFLINQALFHFEQKLLAV